MAVRDARLWYHRLTLNQERELEQVIGHCANLTYTEAITKLTDARIKETDKKRLAAIITDAATKAGCIDGKPLVDDALIEHLRAARQRPYHVQQTLRVDNA